MTPSNNTYLRQALSGSLIRLFGTPIVGVAGLASSAIIIRVAGAEEFGVINMVAMLGALLPFLDLGIGATVTSAAASRDSRRAASSPHLLDTLRTAIRVLVRVSVAVALIAIILAALGWWGGLLGQQFSQAENWLVGVCLTIFAVSIPLGLGVRILIGLGRNDLATAISLAGPLISLAVVALLGVVGASGLVFALAQFLGTFVAALAGATAAVWLLRRSGVGKIGVLQGLRRPTQMRLLSGAQWMLVVNIAFPMGLETGRIILSHQSTPSMLAEYSLMAQFYSLGWSVLVSGGNALWTEFVKRRQDRVSSLRLWRNAVAAFAALAITGGLALTFVSPPLAHWISGGAVSLTIGLAAAFALLLIAQALHLPAGVMLTTAPELRWQASCMILMAVFSVVGSWLLVPNLGPVAVPLCGALSVLSFQFIPDLAWGRVLLRRREGS